MAATIADLSSSETVRNIFVTGLHNAHALEKEAIELMSRQVERFEHYPEMSEILRTHIAETEGQVRRLDEILHHFGDSRSVLKDVMGQLMGNMAAIAHTPMQDEVLKNTFANHAFENFEIASYMSLIAMAEAAGHGRFVGALRESLGEEQKTAGLIHDQIEAITLKYLTREAEGRKADR